MKKTIALLLALAFGMAGGRVFSNDEGQQAFPGTRARRPHPKQGGMDSPRNKKPDRKKAMFMLEVLRQKYPDDVDKLMKLRQDDPEKFREGMKKLGQKLREERAQQKKELAQLIKKYREKPSDDLKQQIMDKLSQQLDERLAVMEKMVEKANKKFEKTKDLLQKRKENKDAIVEQRFKELTMDPALKW